MHHTVIYYDFLMIEHCKIPMIAVIDRHDKSMTFIECFFLENSLDLSLCFAQSTSSKVRVKNAVISVTIFDESFLHHFDVNINDVVIEPLSKFQSSHSPVSQFLNTVEICSLDLEVGFGFTLPVLYDHLVVIEGDERVVEKLI